METSIQTALRASRPALPYRESTQTLKIRRRWTTIQARRGSNFLSLTWCKLFNDLTAKLEASPKIDAAQGLIISSWVRLPDDVPAHLKVLQKKVAECTEMYIQKIEQARQAEKSAGADVGQAEGPQGRLNKIIAALDFNTANLH